MKLKISIIFAVFLFFGCINNPVTPPANALDCGSITIRHTLSAEQITQIESIRECLVESFQTCLPAKAHQTQYTVEGDPIKQDIIIYGKENDQCKVIYENDSSADQFAGPNGGSKITVNCFKLEETENTWSEFLLGTKNIKLSECTDNNDWLLLGSEGRKPQVNNFEECARLGYPIMESYPRQCSTPDGETFTEEAVSQTCRYQQECGQGFYCKNGVCTEFVIETQCTSNEDCLLINNGFGFSCCYAGACSEVDYSQEKWIAANKNWFLEGKQNNCPSEQECGPAPLCPVTLINGNFSAKCINNECKKIEN